MQATYQRRDLTQRRRDAEFFNAEAQRRGVFFNAEAQRRGEYLKNSASLRLSVFALNISVFALNIAVWGGMGKLCNVNWNIRFGEWNYDD